MGGPTRRAVAWLLHETKGFVSGQIDAIDNLDDKAVEVMRFNVMFVGLVAAGLAFVYRTGLEGHPIPAWLLGGFTLGYGLIVASTWAAVAAFLKKAVHVGCHPAGSKKPCCTTSTSMPSWPRRSLRIGKAAHGTRL